MKKLTKILGPISLSLMLIVITGCDMNSQTDQSSPQAPSQVESEQNQPQQSVPESTSTQGEETTFIEGILDQIPEDYVSSEGDFSESSSQEPKKGARVEPPGCALANTSPDINPFCFTILTILDTGKNTTNLEDYIQNNDLATYESRQGGELVQAMYKGETPYVYTSKFFMCLGTGAESCMRKQFVYHLKDGGNVLAEITYYPYENGELVEQPNKEIQEVIDAYEKILIQ